MVNSLIKRLALFFLVFFSGMAYAFEPFFIKDIKVDGNKQLTAGAILDKVSIKANTTLEPIDTVKIIEELFSTQYFDDIALFRDKDTLVISLVERPSISHIKISGNVLLKSQQLREILDAQKISKGKIYNPSHIEQLKNGIEFFYYGSGKYGVKVDVNVEDSKNNTVAIHIKITEGMATKVKEINIIGNKHFSDKQIKKQMSSSTEHLFGFIFKDDQYSKQRFSADIESVKDFYMEHGFLDFKVISNQTSISRDRNYMYLTVNLDEGKRYKIGKIEYLGKNKLLDDDVLAELTESKAGDYYSDKDVNNSVEAIKEKLGDYGYLVPQINTSKEKIEGTDEIDLVFHIEPKRKYYVRNIVFSGNAKTNDIVLRRNMQQYEGGIASQEKIKNSKYKLNNSGYFKKVDINTMVIPDSNDLVDLLVDVDEQSLSRFNFHIDYKGLEGIVYKFAFENKNFIGTGNELMVDLSRSKAKSEYSLSFTEPFYTIEGVSRHLELYYNSYDASKMGKIDKDSKLTNYRSDSFGGVIGFGVPVALKHNIGFSLGFDKKDLILAKDASFKANQFIDKYGTNLREFYTRLGWKYNNLDRFLFPTKGFYSDASVKFTIPGSTVEYFMTDFSTKFLQPLTKDLTWFTKTKINYGRGYGENNDMPFYRNYHMGGGHNVKGYKDYTLGPEYNGENIGGDLLVYGSTGIIFNNLLGFSADSMRFYTFLDAGQLYDVVDSNEHFNFKDIRLSAGFGVEWLAPMVGPITFGLAFPLNKKEGDVSEVFYFSAGFNI